MNKYFDSMRDTLVFTGKKASSEYWDNHWEYNNLRSIIVNNKNYFVYRTTKKYLSPRSVILEGGCGKGDKVYTLNKHGYDVYGIDYAPKIIKKTKQIFPQLKLYIGDVSSLPFRDNFFDGYWSLGVIEHFYYGYDSIKKEMFRTLKKNGFLFLTVPTVSFLRNYKIKKKLYPPFFSTKENIENFFQYAYRPYSIVSEFENSGFELIEHKYVSSLKGLKDEVNLLYKPLTFLNESQKIPAKISKKILSEIVKYFASHMSLFVFKKSIKKQPILF